MERLRQVDALYKLKEAFEEAPYFGVDREAKALCYTLDTLFHKDKVSRDQYNFLDDLIALQADDKPYYWPLNAEGDNERIAWIEQEIKKIKEIEDAKS